MDSAFKKSAYDQQLIWAGMTLNILQTLHSSLCYICIAIHQPILLFQENKFIGEMLTA